MCGGIRLKIGSLYITQTAVIGLADVPLEANLNFRSAFEPIFKNRDCFKNARMNALCAREDEECSKMPFISNLGQLCYNEMSDNFFIEYQDYENHAFRYENNLKDERMYFLCFCLQKSFKILAQYAGKTAASGKIFLHIYPTGYIVVHLAVYRRDAANIEIEKEQDILDLIHETKPWLDGKWKWKSRFGCYSLRETFEQVFQNISLSLFTEGELEIGKPEWRTGVAMSVDLSDGEIRSAIMGHETTDRFIDCRNRDRDIPDGILVAKKRIHYYFADKRRERDTILHSFWKMRYIFEFVLYKNKVYSDYLKYIQKDRNEMRDLNLNKEYKFKVANIVGKDFYRSTFFIYTQFLDEYVTMLGTKDRAMYALFSKVDGFDDKRQKLNHALEAWENDIKVWKGKETGLQKLLKLIIKVRDIL